MKKAWTWIGITVYSILLIVCFCLLLTSRTGNELLSPWQTISHAYIYCFATLTFVLGGLIFSGLSKRWLLVLFVLYSLLLHSYLPLTHELIYGADGWRHIANEASFLDHGSFLHPVLSDGTTGNALQNFIGELSYWQLWVLTALIAKITTVSLVAVNAWLMPIVWGIGFPILLFYFGMEIFGTQTTATTPGPSLERRGERKAFMLVWLSALPFALQSAGSFTLPVNLSFLVWLGSLVALFKWLQQPNKKLMYWLIGFGIVLTLGYALFAVLFWVGLAIAFFVRWFCHTEQSEVSLKQERNGFFVSLRMTIAMVAAGSLIPVLELIARYDSFARLSFLANIKQLIGNFTTAYLASGPRPHTISTGNILFNQVPSYAFVHNFFTVDRWWLVVFASCFLVFSFYGWWQAAERRSEPVFAWLAVFSPAMFLSYIISWYFLAGQHLLVRRLDVVLAFLLVLLFTIGLCAFIDRKTQDTRYKRQPLVFVSCILFFIIFSVAIAASYSLGPTTDTVSSDQYKAMQYVWHQEQGQSHYCVISDVYPLLALEALSNGKIIGGGFPIDANFNQPELEKFWQNGFTRDAFATTDATKCFVFGKGNPEENLVNVFGAVGLWEYTK